MLWSCHTIFYYSGHQVITGMLLAQGDFLFPRHFTDQNRLDEGRVIVVGRSLSTIMRITGAP